MYTTIHQLCLFLCEFITFMTMKKLILLLLFIPLVSCDISSLFAPSLNMDDFPFKIDPFDKKSELMESSKNDPLCGTFKYYSGESENGIVDIFKYNKVYYLHYQRDDNAQYIGIGIKKDQLPNALKRFHTSKLSNLNDLVTFLSPSVTIETCPTIPDDWNVAISCLSNRISFV